MAINTANLKALHEGKLSYATYYRLHRADLERLAKQLWGRWPAHSVGIEDLVQEMLLALFRKLPSWDAGRAPVLRYAVWTMCAAAKALLHNQRDARLRHDKSPSRAPLPRDPSVLERQLSQEPTQEQAAELFMRLARVAAGADAANPAPPVERMVVNALAEHGSVEGAAAALYGSARRRTALRLGSEKEAQQLVRRAIKSTAERCA